MPIGEKIKKRCAIFIGGSQKRCNASVKLCDSGLFFTTKDTKRPEKISWEVRRMLAVNAASMKFFRGRFVRFVVQKEFFC